MLSNNINLPKSIKNKSSSLQNNTDNPPTQTINQPITCDVQKNTAIVMGSRDKYSTWLCLMLFLSLNPTTCAVFFVHHSKRYFNIYLCMYVRTIV